jgi:hypothetical protein
MKFRKGREISDIGGIFAVSIYIYIELGYLHFPGVCELSFLLSAHSLYNLLFPFATLPW